MKEMSPRAAAARQARLQEQKKTKLGKIEPPKPRTTRIGKDIDAKRKPIRPFEKHEHATAKGFTGGRLTPGSGNKHIKGDVDTPLLRIENKCTGKTQYAFKAEVWKGIAGQANAAGKEPAYAILMDGLPPLVVIEEALLQNWHNELIELREYKRKKEAENG